VDRTLLSGLRRPGVLTSEKPRQLERGRVRVRVWGPGRAKGRGVAGRSSGGEAQLVPEEHDIVARVLAIEYQATYYQVRGVGWNFNDANLRTDDEMSHTTGVADLV
jgi:hypothetical protein